MAVVDLEKLGLFTSVSKKLYRSLVVIVDHPNLGIGFKPILENGVYQMRRYGNKIVCTREKFYQVADQFKGNRPASQAKFAAAVLAWQGLTDLKKSRYNELAVGRHFSGYNLFIRDYMHG
jgi:hypothetical protein